MPQVTPTTLFLKATATQAHFTALLPKVIELWQDDPLVFHTHHLPELRSQLSNWPDSERTYEHDKLSKILDKHPSLHAELPSLERPDLPWPEWMQVVASMRYEDAASSRIQKQLLSQSAPAHLSELVIDHCKLTSAALAKLVKSPFLHKLTTLKLRQNKNLSQGVVALAQNPHMLNLERLDLSGVGTMINEQALTALACSPYMISLRDLNISWTKGDRRDDLGITRGLCTLLSSPYVRLYALRAEHCHIQSKDLAMLVDTPNISFLTCLDIDSNPLGDEDLKLLYRNAEKLARLTQLRFPFWDVSSRTIDAFLASDLAERITHLTFDIRNDERAIQLADSRLHHLQELHLSGGNSLSSKGLDALLQAPFTSTLERLVITNPSFGPESVKFLLDPTWQRLHTLCLEAPIEQGRALRSALEASPRVVLSQLREDDSQEIYTILPPSSFTPET